MRTVDEQVGGGFAEVRDGTPVDPITRPTDDDQEA